MKLTPTEKLFLAAHRCNWDGGTGALKKILGDPACDLGTALLIYWRGRPEFYRQWAVDAVPSLHRETFELVRFAEQKILAGTYPSVICYDPRKAEEVGLYDDEVIVRQLPAAVYQPSGGAILAEDLIEGRRGEGAFLTAAQAGNLELVKEMLQGGMEVDAVDRGMTALGAAAAGGQVEVVELLLAAGANPKVKRSDDGHMAIHHAVYGERSVRVIERLLAAGVKVDQPAKYKLTPLHLAAMWGRADLAAFLIERGAKRDLRYRHGETAVHVAAHTGNLAVLELLLAAGWDLHAVDDNGLHALHHAVDFPGWNWIDTIDRGPIAKLLIERGSDLTARTKAGKTPAELAQSNQESRLGPKEKEAIARLLESAQGRVGIRRRAYDPSSLGSEAQF